jgi:hypothetical protein
LTSVSIRRRSATVNGARVVIEGSRDTNSGINLRGSESWKDRVARDVPVFNKIWMKRGMGKVAVVNAGNSPAVSTRSNALWDVFLFGVKNGKESPCSGVGRVAVKPMDLQNN